MAYKSRMNKTKPKSCSQVKRRRKETEFYREVLLLEKKYGINRENTIGIIVKNEGARIPISIFSNKKLSSLECIVRYLRENKRLKYKEIGQILNRSQFTIASTYSAAVKKCSKQLPIKFSEIDIPIETIADRKYSPLESIVMHLRKLGMRFSEIAKALELDQRTIWTIDSRAKKKEARAGKRASSLSNFNKKWQNS